MHRITLLPVVVAALGLAFLSAPTFAGDAPAERTGIIKRGETPMTLVGPAVKVGDKAPSSALWGPKLEEVNIDFADGTTRVVLFVPSVDTPTCSMQTRTFNTRAPEAGGGAEVIVISRDLPYAQSRFCAANGIEMVFPRSDYRTGNFGRSWGLFVKETGLLARAVAIVDGTGTIRYLQIVPDLGDEPDYDAALEAVKGIAAG